LSNSLFCAKRAKLGASVLGGAKQDVPTCIAVRTALCKHGRKAFLFEDSEIFEREMAHGESISRAR
jgi:hypothetical protein